DQRECKVEGRVGGSVDGEAPPPLLGRRLPVAGLPPAEQSDDEEAGYRGERPDEQEGDHEPNDADGNTEEGASERVHVPAAEVGRAPPVPDRERERAERSREERPFR